MIYLTSFIIRKTALFSQTMLFEQIYNINVGCVGRIPLRFKWRNSYIYCISIMVSTIQQSEHYINNGIHNTAIAALYK